MVILFIIFITGSLSLSDINPKISFASEWYSGGNLSKKKISDWAIASYRNRLATSADFVSVWIGHTRDDPARYFANGQKLLKEKAVSLERCITLTTNNTSLFDKTSVSNIASICLVLKNR